MALGDDYATRAELAAAFRIGDADDDDQLDLAITAASQWVTQYCDRDFNQADSATARTFHAFSSGMVWVDDISTTTGLLVATDDGDDGTYETLWVSTDYQLEPLNGMVGGLTGWPYTHIRAVGESVYPTGVDRPAVQITARWGWPAVPAAVKQATLILAARLYKRRDSAEGVLAGFDFGPVRVGTRLDPDVEMLLSPYRKTTVRVG
jgi:hypothetical protein